uniref:Uncharacterized protein n=1 Tax=Denticeps clupeoides TaxID=299321 RepID=A0AAY4BRN7_9TELE
MGSPEEAEEPSLRHHVAGAIIQYYQYPHVTILDEMDSPVMYFPAITLCNYNSFRRSKILRNDLFWMAGLLGVEQGDFDDFMAALGQPVDDGKFFPSKTFNMLEFLSFSDSARRGSAAQGARLPRLFS